MESLQTQNTFTDDETSLAAKYKVEPKLVRLIAEIVGEHTAELNELINLKAEPEQAEPQEQPAEQEQPEEPCIDQQTQERIKSYFKNLDPKTKLAVIALSEIQFLDGINFQARNKGKGEERLVDLIWADLESNCVETFHRESDDIAVGRFSSEDVWFCGVWEAVRMVSQNC